MIGIVIPAWHAAMCKPPGTDGKSKEKSPAEEENDERSHATGGATTGTLGMM